MPTCTRLLLGITKAALSTDSFPVRRLLPGRPPRCSPEAAIYGKVDHLLGLKRKCYHRQADPRRYWLGSVPPGDMIDDDGDVIQESSGEMEEDLFLEEGPMFLEEPGGLSVEGADRI